MAKRSREGILSSYLRHKRIAANLSQREVAKSLGYGSPQFVSNWERGISSPPGNVIPKLAELYHLPQKEFVGVLLKEQETMLHDLFKSSARSAAPRKR